MSGPVVIMGVSGCGKSSLAAALATGLGWPLVEGDTHHSPANRQKMQAGIPLTDTDRAGWLDTLAQLLAAHAPGGCVMTCSALKQRYRDQLRQAAPGLRFIFLAIQPDQALARVSQRSDHFFAPGLVSSQFEALEDPSAEPGVLRLDADHPLPLLQAQALAWLQAPTLAPTALP